MLREIINFTRDLNQDLFIRNVQPSEGLHLIVWLDSTGRLNNYEYKIYKKRQEIDLFLQECLKREFNSKCVSSQKRLDAPFKLNGSCSPFCISIKKSSLLGLSEKLKNKNMSLADYFQKTGKAAIPFCENEEEKLKADQFFRWCAKDLIALLKTIPDFGDLNENKFVNIYLGDIPIKNLKSVHLNYLRPKVFNKEEFNDKINGEIYGVSDYLTGFNQKKPFLRHLTATFDVNSRVNEDDALWLYRFSQLKANNQLPNPLPIFVEKRELNQEVVEIFNREGGKISYSQIIESVYRKHQDLGNYYLLNIQGKAVKDFDFVSSFGLYIEPPIRIQPLFTGGGNLGSKSINNIFEFEREIVQRIFNNQLIQKTKNEGWRYRYFDDIEYKPQFIRAAIYRLVLKYRKAFYDYIYKSKREAINSLMFHDIMKTIILDEIRQDEQHNKSFSIKEKLNIWFSLYEFFDQPLKKGENGTMANQIIHLQERMREIAEQSDAHINDNNEFAFAAGQVIYFLLDQSETGNKTHALLEPFLQKTDCEQFKMAISRTLDRYKHKIHFAHKRFNKLASEVLGYATEENIKNLLPMILAGYFSDNVIYGKRVEKEVETEVDSGE